MNLKEIHGYPRGAEEIELLSSQKCRLLVRNFGLYPMPQTEASITNIGHLYNLKFDLLSLKNKSTHRVRCETSFELVGWS